MLRSLAPGFRRMSHPKIALDIQMEQKVLDRTYGVREFTVVSMILRIRSHVFIPRQRIRLVLRAIQIGAVENRISKSFAFPGHVFTDRSGGRIGGLCKLC